MVARSAKHIERMLLRKGFRFYDTHHRYLGHFLDGERSGIYTKVSHGVNDYGDALLAQMCQQLHLSKAELLKLIDCELSGEQYAELLRARGHIK